MKSDYASIKTKLQRLEQLDLERQIFGSQSHNYKLNDPASEFEIISFENQHGVTLPKGYREFLLFVGNGGAGPYYGLQRLQNSLYLDIDYQRDNEYVDPSKPFLITESWNLKYTGCPDNVDKYRLFEDEYFDSKWVNGLLRLCNYGCGISMNLVVNGPEYGNIWIDDRCNDGGIYPESHIQQESRVEFLDWYMLWLENSLASRIE